MPTLWSRLFGPSTTDRLLDVLREDRAAQAAQTAANTALLTTLVAQQAAQSDLARQQLALLTAPAGEPIVRTMTDADEALFERQRRAARTATSTDGLRTIDPTALLAELEASIHDESRRDL